jgi:acetolactate decarboxylase
MKNKIYLLLFAVIVCVLGALIYENTEIKANVVIDLSGDPQTLVQYSTLDALLAGHYDGVATLADFKKQGTLGIGTFNGLDGEMVFYKDTVYQVKASGEVVIPEEKNTTPFACAVDFDPETTETVTNVTSYAQLKDVLNGYIKNPNLFYAFRVKGHFTKVHTRSVPAQEKPYKPLAEVVKHQPEFNFENIDGVLVGFYCPAYVKGINVPGFHLHFLSEDKKSGGHLLNVAFDEAEVSVDKISAYKLILPDTVTFASESFDKDTEAETKAVEGS